MAPPNEGDSLEAAARNLLRCFDPFDPQHEAWWEAAGEEHETIGTTTAEFKQRAIERLRATLPPERP